MLAYDFEKDGVTQTLMTQWLDCPERADLFLQGYTPNKISWAMNFGSVAHDALRLLNTDFGNGGVCAEKALANFKASEGGRWATKETEAFELMRAQMPPVISEYDGYWEKSDRNIEWENVEGVFKVPFMGTFLRGRFDGAIIIDGGLWLFESKTKAQISESLLSDVLYKDYQVNFYLLALWKLTGKMPRGTLYNIIRRPGIKLNKDETLPNHTTRLNKHINKDKEHYYKRFEVASDEEDLRAFEAELTEQIEMFGGWTKQRRPNWTYGMPCQIMNIACKYVPICHAKNFSPYYIREILYPELED